MRHDVMVAGQRLRVDIRPGEGTGVPILMCGGIGAALGMLRPLVQALPRAAEIIRFDPPGIGGSPPAMLPYSLPQLAWQLRILLNDLGHERVDLLGYSWGGALAQQFALQHPGRCRRLVLVSSSPGLLSVPGDARVLATMLTPRHLEPPAEAVAGSDRRPGRSRRTRPADGPHLTADRSPRVRLSVLGPGFLHQLSAVASWTSLPFLPLLQPPTLIMSGADDPVVPVLNAQLMAGLIPGATLAVFPGGHLEIVVAPEVISEPVGRFLR